MKYLIVDEKLGGSVVTYWSTVKNTGDGAAN